MPLAFELRSRSGTVLAVTGEVEDSIPATLPELDPAAFPLAGSIDRYGRVIFNGGQMRRLAAELEAMLDGAPPKRAKLLNDIIRMCESGSQQTDVELWVLGD